MDLLLSLLTKFFIYAIFLFSLNNIVIGKTGYWAIGHIAYFAIGALFTGVITVIFHFTGYYIYLALFGSIIISIIFSLIPALSILRLRGDFFIFVSITINELIKLLVELISGPSGFSNIPRPPGLTTDLSLMCLSSIIFLILVLYASIFKYHNLNYITTIVRQNEELAKVMGINVYYIRSIFIILGCATAGAAGSLFAFYSNSTDPQRFNINEAVILFALCAFGGIDSIRGTIIASMFYVLILFVLESIFKGLFQIYTTNITSIIFGLILIFSINFFPQGIMGKRGL
ncbi:MAG: branched-chain amino acid ABC transporter permease [Bacteroidetes bacterium]|nr:MAG: branched-chain amino acid ABC transporter permease [Bacteroidota bacterium]